MYAHVSQIDASFQVDWEHWQTSIHELKDLELTCGG